MRTTSSTGRTKILPSPTWPVRAALVAAAMTSPTRASSTTTSILTLTTKSTWYSAPRYTSLCPPWRPKPLTSLTVMPLTPISAKAALTSSSLKVLVMISTFFMTWLLLFSGIWSWGAGYAW